MHICLTEAAVEFWDSDSIQEPRGDNGSCFQRLSQADVLAVCCADANLPSTRSEQHQAVPLEQLHTTPAYDHEVSLLGTLLVCAAARSGACSWCRS